MCCKMGNEPDLRAIFLLYKEPLCVSQFVVLPFQICYGFLDDGLIFAHNTNIIVPSLYDMQILSFYYSKVHILPFQHTEHHPSDLSRFNYNSSASLSLVCGSLGLILKSPNLLEIS
jgi:hypothetical protein